MLAGQLSVVVNRQPNSIAIEDGRRGSITYKELWQYLQATCAALEERLAEEAYIGIVADQDAYAVIASIATMLSGRVIIPLDPRLEPPLMEQALAPFTKIVLSENRAPLGEAFINILFDDIITKLPTKYIFSAANKDAYILHTSGTTGRPKPVLADQAALLRVASSLADRYHITPKSKVLQFAYLSFDSSLVEIWSTLLGGGTIVIPGQLLRDDLYGCIESLLREGAITTATLPPSVASNLNPEHLSALNTLVLAGDEFPADLANKLYPRISHLINAYGPTESIICSTTFEITSPQENRVPIGTPLPGMDIFIDSPDSGGRGEMILASTYLAKGYASSHKLTDEKFPIYKGRRAYRSGDIGRLNKDGVYEFFGRVDNQVKINGQRVELEGVEAHIRNATKNSAVAVVSYNDSLFCVYQADKPLGEFANLGLALSNSLPDYAIPRLSIPMKKLPLDLNGKINRKALRNFVAHNVSLNQVTNSPAVSNPEMIRLWSLALKIPENTIQPDTNFFAIGGDSLSALRLVRLINSHYLCTVRLSDIIKNPTTPESMLNAVKDSNSGAPS